MLLSSLKNQKQFDLVNSFGKRVSTKYFTVVLAKNFDLAKNLKPVRSNDSSTTPHWNESKLNSGIDSANSACSTFLGMKVGKKLSRKACIRNKIKRRIRHLMRLALIDPELNLVKSAIVFVPYKNFELIKFSELALALKNVLVTRF